MSNVTKAFSNQTYAQVFTLMSSINEFIGRVLFCSLLIDIKNSRRSVWFDLIPILWRWSFVIRFLGKGNEERILESTVSSYSLNIKKRNMVRKKQ